MLLHKMSNINKYKKLCQKAELICENKLFYHDLKKIIEELHLISDEIKNLRENEENKYMKKLLDDYRIQNILQNIMSGDEINIVSFKKNIIFEMQRCLLCDIMNFIGGYNEEKNIIGLIYLTECVCRYNKKMNLHGMLVYKIRDDTVNELKDIINKYQKPEKFYFDINKITNDEKIIKFYKNSEQIKL